MSDNHLFRPKAINGIPNKLRNPMEQLCWTVADFQQAMNIGRNTAYELVNRADFPKIRMGRKIIIPRDAFLRWLDQQTASEA